MCHIGSFKRYKMTNPEFPQIDSKYSIDQQLRLGCNEKGKMYDFSIVLI